MAGGVSTGNEVGGGAQTDSRREDKSMTLVYIVGGPVVLALLMLRAGGFGGFG